MKDKIMDLIYAFQDNRDKFMPFFKLFMALLGLFVLLGLFLGWFEGSPPEESIVEGVYEEVTDYEYLSFKNVSQNEKLFLPSIDLLFLRPNIEYEEAEEFITYMDIKMRKEAELLGKEFSGMKINIFRRSIEYELGLNPSGLYTYFVNGSATDTINLEKIPKNKDVYVKSFEFNVLKEVPDIEVFDGDGIVIETIEVPKFMSDSDYLKLLKLNEYRIIFNSKNKAAGFYVFYDMNIRNIDGDKYNDKYDEVLEFYNNSSKLNEYLPEIDQEQLILDYRENHIDVWSNVVVFRGY